MVKHKDQQGGPLHPSASALQTATDNYLLYSSFPVPAWSGRAYSCLQEALQTDTFTA